MTTTVDDDPPPTSYFDKTVFIIDGDAEDVPAGTQFLCNQGGRAKYSPTPVGTQIPITPEDPSLGLGTLYSEITFGQKRMNWGTKWAYILTEFDFKTHGNPVVLADLWVQKGDLLFVPPKVYSDEYTDMHGNRNSAFACWGVDGRRVLETRTMLADEAIFTAEETRPHYH